MEKLDVLVLYDSAEDEENAAAVARGELREVLVSEQIAAALSERGHAVRRLAARGSVIDLAREIVHSDCDIVFNVCESFRGDTDHEHNVAALLELAGKPYTGTSPLGLALARDKGLAKKLLGVHGIATPRFAVTHDGQLDYAEEIEFPMFVKPANMDGSVGIDGRALVRNVKELMERISFIERTFDAPSLIEEFIDGREIYVPVLDGDPPEALPIVEWDLSAIPEGAPRIAGFIEKWDRSNAANKTPETCPEDIPATVVAAMQHAAVEAFRALKLRDYGRVDIRLRPPQGTPRPDDPLEGWRFFLIEVNPNPYLAQDVELPIAAARLGLSYPELIERILASALTRSLRRRPSPTQPQAA